MTTSGNHAGFALAALAAVAAFALVTDARAAVRLCKEQVASGPVTGATEQAAKKRALDAWKTKAAAFGDGYTSWRLAGGKVLKCLPAAGGFECVARAAPCIIEQAPDRRELRKNRIPI